MHGLSDKKFRSYYLGQARKTCDVLGLAETNCTSEENERLWARDWREGSGVFWASYKGVGSSVGRGVALLFSNALSALWLYSCSHSSSTWRSLS